ncbi:MAG: hypothetical protein ACI8QZ_000896 [Chlamydiales bacterium]|jgi:hypothetical protein
MLKLLALAVLMTPAIAPGIKIVPREGDPAPLFEGEWMAYEDTTLAQLEGKLVFIEFWRTW